MSDLNLPAPVSNSNRLLKAAAWMFGGLLTIAVLMAGTLALQTPVGQLVPSFFKWLFALDSVQLMWYITRAAGFTSYLLIWFSVAWGLAVSNKILDQMLHRQFTYDFHQFISLLAIAFLALHIGVLMADRYLPYTLVQILVPFLSPYRPVWVGIGVISLYLTLLVTVTYYLRGKIGMKAFRSIHVFSLVAYLGATVHGFFSGTDSSLPAVQWVYLGSFLVVVFLMTYWLIFLNQKNSVHTSVVRQKP